MSKYWAIEEVISDMGDFWVEAETEEKAREIYKKELQRWFGDSFTEEVSKRKVREISNPHPLSDVFHE